LRDFGSRPFMLLHPACFARYAPLFANGKRPIAARDGKEPE